MPTTVPQLLALTGPTGSGKSAVALEFAGRINAEIINSDSVSLYQGFRIGAAAPSQEDCARVRHHLLLSEDSRNALDAASFGERARTCAVDITQRKRVPLLVGGSALYLRASIAGLASIEGDFEEAARHFAAGARERGIDDADVSARVGPVLHEWLHEVDAELAARLSPSDTARIRRGLLVCFACKKTLSEIQKQEHVAPVERALVFCLMPSRERLYAALNLRVERMLSEGLVEETRSIRETFGDVDALKSIGYRHAKAYLDGECDTAEMERTLKRDTRRFAKRQLTWFRHQPAALGWEVEELLMPKDADDLIELLVDSCSRFLSDSSLQGVKFIQIAEGNA